MTVYDILKNLVQISSISGDEIAIGNWLKEYLEKLNFKTKILPLKHAPERFNVLAEKGSGDKCLLLYGHMDTVEVAKGWKTDPFDLVQEGDKLYGLGSNDMKGGIAAILHAIKNFETGNYKLKICFAADEEWYSAGAFELVGSGWIDDVDFCIVPEIGDDDITSKKEKDPIRVTLGRRGRISIQVDVIGKSAHGAVQHEGINAVETACSLLPILKEKILEKIDSDPEIGWKGDIFGANISGGGIFLSVPERASFILNRHFLPSMSAEACIKEVKQAITEISLKKGVKIEVKPMERPVPYLKAFTTPKSNESVMKLVEIIEDHFKKPVNYSYGLSVADENLLGQHVPTAVYGPVGDKSHQADEYVSLYSLEELSKIFLKFLKRF